MFCVRTTLKTKASKWPNPPWKCCTKHTIFNLQWQLITAFSESESDKGSTHVPHPAPWIAWQKLRERERSRQQSCVRPNSRIYRDRCKPHTTEFYDHPHFMGRGLPEIEQCAPTSWQVGWTSPPLFEKFAVDFFQRVRIGYISGANGTLAQRGDMKFAWNHIELSVHDTISSAGFCRRHVTSPRNFRPPSLSKRPYKCRDSHRLFRLYECIVLSQFRIQWRSNKIWK